MYFFYYFFVGLLADDESVCKFMRSSNSNVGMSVFVCACADSWIVGSVSIPFTLCNWFPW